MTTPTDLARLREVAETTCANLRPHGIVCQPETTNIPVPCAVVLALIAELEAARAVVRSLDELRRELLPAFGTFAEPTMEALAAYDRLATEPQKGSK